MRDWFRLRRMGDFHHKWVVQGGDSAATASGNLNYERSERSLTCRINRESSANIPMLAPIELRLAHATGAKPRDGFEFAMTDLLDVQLVSQDTVMTIALTFHASWPSLYPILAPRAWKDLCERGRRGGAEGKHRAAHHGGRGCDFPALGQEDPYDPVN